MFNALGFVFSFCLIRMSSLVGSYWLVIFRCFYFIQPLNLILVEFTCAPNPKQLFLDKVYLSTVAK
jgi:hypothetical protein